jgi:hypothetical protein
MWGKGGKAGQRGKSAENSGHLGELLPTSGSDRISFEIPPGASMSHSGALRITRPYPSLDAYLEGDAWTVERSDMLLIGIDGIAPGTPIEFEIVLSSGDTVVKGEGRAVETVPARGGRPGGLKVRFKKLEGSSKATLKRALEMQKRGPRIEETKSAPEAAPAPAPVDEVKSAPAAAPAPAPMVNAAPPATPGDETPRSEPRKAKTETSRTTAEPSGVRHRAVGPVAAPTNRDELLARLRGRRGGAAAE